jgi:hypothetical protein
MDRYALTLGLLGLRAVSSALPVADKRQTFGIGGGSSNFGPGDSQPTTPCLVDVPLAEQPPCIITSIGTFNPGKRQTFGIGGGSSSFSPGSTPKPCLAGIPLTEQPPCILGSTSTFRPGKRQIFGIGGGSSSFKPGSTPKPCLAGISLTEQPPCILGSTTTFRPGKRQIFGIGGGSSNFGPGGSAPTTPCLAGIPLAAQPPCIITSTGTFRPGKEKRFSLPPDSQTNINDAIDTLEKELEALQNKKDKTYADYQQIVDYQAALSYLVNVEAISAPPGTTTTFHPGKRSELVNVKDCSNLAGTELAYEHLIQKGKLSPQEARIAQQLADYNKACGVTIDKSPPGTSTTIKPSDKRQTFTIGKQACQDSNISVLKAVLAALTATYGSPSKAPANVFTTEQVIVSILHLCGKPVDGWTVIIPGIPIPGGPITPDPTVPGGPITPDPTVPGGPIVPDPTVPGGPIVPDPTIPGGPIHPSDKRQLLASDPTALLEALTILESSYGTYGSGTIPVPVFLIMEGMVTILQSNPGVVVPGWPILGAGSTTTKPSD